MNQEYYLNMSEAERAGHQAQQRNQPRVNLGANNPNNLKNMNYEKAKHPDWHETPTTASDCSCGSGKLGPKQYNDGQFMGGFTVSRKCKKCGMLHFFQDNERNNHD